MKIQLVTQPIVEVSSQWLILGMFEEEPGIPAGLEGTGLAATVRRLRASKDVSGSLNELTAFHDPSGLAAASALLVGLGPRARFDAGAAFGAAVAATKRLAGKARESVALVVPDVEETAGIVSAMVEGAIVGTRGPGLRLTEPNRHPFGTLSIVTGGGAASSSDALQAVLRRAEIVGQAVNLARDLANTPPAEKSPATLADRVRLVAEDAGLFVEVWDADRIERERFGGLASVAAGSSEPPRFVVLQHRKGGDGPTLALVGKGVTFDSGGLSLKPSSSMEDMKSDMTGAAVVLATMVAAARLSLHVNVVGYLAITENMTGGRAVKLGDVLTMRDGTTVEIMNTDAEGRLILADALAYAAERKPARIIDLATLTGACMVALGSKVAGLFSNDEHFASDLASAARRAGERVWRMPLDADYKELLKSNVADLKNVGGKYAGAVTAAKFLEVFVGETPWAHLDIAGPSWSDGDSAAQDPGGTGCFVRTLVALLMEKAGREGRGY
ncbi:MAG: leucyl aminopeptidase [Planctomycetota bacterium]|nr:leucyl aminopeptidase [Planctomycetota bacterium]